MPMDFVKADNETNDEYLETCKQDRWWPAIEKAHKALLALDPSYRIDQIKEKFGGMRYYFNSSPGLDKLVLRRMALVAAQAELEADFLTLAAQEEEARG